MRYRLLGVKAQGGQGVICEALDRVLQRRVAVKLAPLQNPGASRMLDEARALAKFSHPRVVTVHDAGIDDGFAFVVMDLVDGEPADVVAMRPGFTPRAARRIVSQAAEGLEALHAAGLVHGDISPRNILVGQDGRTRLIDLGFASTGDIVGGTPGFVAPEVTRGGRASPRADQYALGRVLQRLLALSRRSVATSVVATRATAARSEDRYPTIAAFRRALRWAPLRTAAPWLALGSLLLLPTRPPAEIATQIDTLEHQAMAAARDGRPHDAVALADRAAMLAEREDSTELRVRSLLLLARVEDEDGEPRLQRAVALATDLPDLRAEALALLAGREESLSGKRTLLSLAESSTADAPPTGLFSAVRAQAELPDTSPSPPPLALLIGAMLRAADTIEEPEAAIVPLDCEAFDERLIRADCLALDAAALADKDPARARTRAEQAIALLQVVDDAEGLGLALWARAVANLEDDPGSAHDDLVAALATTPDASDEDQATFRATLAYALVLLDRPEQARPIMALVEPWHRELGTTTRDFYARAEAALNPP